MNSYKNGFKAGNSETGAYVRSVSSFRDLVSSSKDAKYPVEANRYHLYVSFACPWAHRTLIVRALKGLEDIIPVYAVYPTFSPYGWRFDKDFVEEEKLGKNVSRKNIYNFDYLKDLYEKANSNYDGRYTVPVLWDSKTETIVNNESSEIIRMMNTEFNEFAKYPKVNFYPKELRSKIDELNDWIYPTINNGVYKSGFAQKQAPYEEACRGVFESLDKVEEILSKSRYLTGNDFTEADIRLFTTLVRFDIVYYVHFKTNKKHVYEYPNIWAYTREILAMEGIKETTKLNEIKTHYYTSHPDINKFGIVPSGPNIDFTYKGERENTK
eukprot:gene950-9857_t